MKYILAEKLFRFYVWFHNSLKKICPRLVWLICKVIPFWYVYDWLYRAKTREKVFYHKLGENKFVIDLNDPRFSMRIIMYNYLLLKEYEPETTKIVKKIIKKGDTIIDIGASIGYFSFLTSKLVGKTGKIYAIEPTEMGFNFLCRNRIANQAWNVYPYKMAAWDKEEPVFVPLNAEGSNRIWANGIRIDKLVKSKVDFIKCDVDGAEPQVLRGLIKTFEHNPKLKMVFEYYPKYIEMAGGDPKEVMKIIDKYFIWKKISGDYGKGYWNLFCQRKI